VPLYFFIPPVYSLQVHDFSHVVGGMAYLVSCGVVMALGEANRRSMASLDLTNQELQQAVAEREKTEAALRMAHDELEQKIRERTAELESSTLQVRRLSASLLVLQDQERRRIAREHDSIGQSLVALSLNLTSLEPEAEQNHKIAVAVTQSTALILQISQEIRTISYLLHPPLLDEAGLEVALRWYVEGFSERSKIRVELDMPGDFGRLPPELEVAVLSNLAEP
jgi:signal transduction histidine kinase